MDGATENDDAIRQQTLNTIACHHALLNAIAPCSCSGDVVCSHTPSSSLLTFVASWHETAIDAVPDLGNIDIPEFIIECYTRAADKGCGSAQLALGNAYSRGEDCLLISLNLFLDVDRSSLHEKA